MKRRKIGGRPLDQRRQLARTRRAGVTAVDAVAGVALSAIIAVTAAQLAARAHRAAHQRTVRAMAVLEAENVLQRARAADAAQLEQMAGAELGVSQDAAAWLPSGRVDLRLEEEPGSAEARVQRLVASVSWGKGRTPLPRKVEVVGWRILPPSTTASTGETP